MKTVTRLQPRMIAILLLAGTIGLLLLMHVTSASPQRCGVNVGLLKLI